ncbi:MAG: tRNA 2-thiouridine(34) synthase MnmA [Planctomycetes bacterium]|nr:tRNA 2-thiouridine(34) synthase MnmA [Planctomycetota bacterium]
MANNYNIKLQSPSFSAWSPGGEVSRQVAVMMSGGVDSSVTAHLLKEQGFEVVGITMQIPAACNTGSRGCCGADAAFVCEQLGICHYFVDVRLAFEQLIIEPFRKSYLEGQTPNPCVDCNTLLKFSLVWDLLEKEFGIKYVATGHYAQVIENQGRYYLGRGKDKNKDQSYFLYGIGLDRLPGFILPLGGLAKQEVRAIASELDLTVADKAESMELCFAGEGDYRVALTVGQADMEGELTDMSGKVIGAHKGISNYTIGQRRGLGYAGGEPLYVGKIDAGSNTVALGTRDEVSFSKVQAGQLNVLIAEEFTAGAKLFGKVRSYNDPLACTVVDVSESGVSVEFDEVLFAPTPGQKLVIYNEYDYIVAGGTITKACK